MGEQSTDSGHRSYPEGLVDRDAWLDPFDWYREMRDEHPIQYDPVRDAYDVFRYEDAAAIARDTDTFSSDPRNSHYFDEDQGASPMRETMISADPPRHDRLRGIVDGHFHPDAIADLEPVIRERATELVDGIVAQGGGDFVTDFADPLPTTAIAELLGIPHDDRDQFADWVDVVCRVHMLSDGSPEKARVARDRYGSEMEAISAYFGDALARRRENPRDDLLTRVAVGRDGEQFDAREMLGFCLLMMFGGTVTTKNLLANTLWCLADRPDLLRTYEAGDGDVPGLVEEANRYRSPLQGLSRFAVEPTEIHGYEIDEQEIVVFWIGSANHDERVFDDPEAFRPERDPNRHLGFGSGPHYCIGAPLARLEARVALTELFDRLSGIEIDTSDLTPIRSDGKLVYGVESLPFSFERVD